MLGKTRNRIINELESVLSGITAIGGRVVYGEVEPNIGIPNLTYDLYSEEIDPDSMYMSDVSDPMERKLYISIEGRSSLPNGSETMIDDLCLEVEKRVATGSTLNDWCKYLELDSTSYDVDDGDTPLGLFKLNYMGYYQEADENKPTDTSYIRAPSAMTMVCNTKYPSKITIRLIRELDGSIYYSIPETDYTTNHYVVVNVPATNEKYFVAYIMTSLAYGLDIPKYGDPPYADELPYIIKIGE
jgi:hypothetical protein